MLNLCLILPLLSSTINGLDGSLNNGTIFPLYRTCLVEPDDYIGLQILPAWQDFFGAPEGRELGSKILDFATLHTTNIIILGP